MSFPDQFPRVPSFSPIRPRGPRSAVRRLLRRRARPLAAVMALCLAALTAHTLAPFAGPPPDTAGGAGSDLAAARRAAADPGSPADAAGADPAASGGDAATGTPDGAARPADTEPDQLVRSPVRVWDAAAARLLTPGDVVDVFAVGPEAGQVAEERAGPAPAHRLAHRVRVVEVPEPADGGWADPVGGALVVVEVPPTVAAALAGAPTDSRLTVTRW